MYGPVRTVLWADGSHWAPSDPIRGADCVQLLVPALRARTRSWTGHREPHKQTAFACEAHGAGQHRDSTTDRFNEQSRRLRRQD